MLLAKPVPYTNESLGSILMRASSLNGWSDPKSMIFEHNQKIIQSPHFFRNRKEIQNQLFQLGITLSNTDQNYEIQSSKNCRVIRFDEKINLPVGVMRHEGNAVCPSCLKDAQFLKKTWLLKLVSTCSSHGCLLIDSCPKCNRQLDWNRPAPHLCRCEFDLREISAIQGNISVAKSVDIAISSQDMSTLVQMAENFLALETLYSKSSNQLTEEQINNISLHGIQTVRDHISSYIKDRESIEHPRVALTSLLIGTESEKELAKSVLQVLTKTNISRMSSATIEGTFLPREAAAALGLSKASFLTSLVNAGILENGPVSNRGTLTYSIESIDRLLRKLWIPTTEENSLIRKRPITEKIAKLALQVLAFPQLNAGYDLDKGICGLRRMKETNIRPSDIRYENYFTIEEAATKLTAYKKVIYSLITNRYLTAKYLPYQGKRIYISKEQFFKFDQRFVFVGLLSKKIGASRTQFIRYLELNGVKPIGGNGYDKLCAYLVERQALEGLDLSNIQIKKIRKRPKVTIQKVSEPEIAYQYHPEYLVIADVAKQLKLSKDLVLKLVRKNVLQVYHAPITSICVARSSFEEFQKKTNSKLFETVQNVLAILNENRITFDLKWVQTGLVKITQVGAEEAITKQEFKKIASLKNRFVTAKEGGLEFNRGKHFLPNLEKRGLIHSVKIGTKKVIKMYERDEVRKRIFEEFAS